MRLAASALALVLAAPAFAADPWTLVDGHAQITFTADHMGFSLVQGRFNDFEADVRFNPEAVEDSEVSVTIDAESIDTGHTARDEHLRGADFLNVAEHPTITFVSTEVEPTSETTAKLTGDLTLLGETREVVWDATLNKLAESPVTGQPTAGLTITGEIPRAEFGVSYGADAFAASIPVRIDVEISPAAGAGD